MKMSKKRLQLLIRLEKIIGNECHNANIQNWGAGGQYEGAGRGFRYPITFIDSDGEKTKCRHVDHSLPAPIAMTGHYAFGSNSLHIMRALNQAIDYLAREHDLKI